MTIIRSAGIQGRTRGLDQAVEWQAAWLAKTFGRAAEIRFRRDRSSGSAWVTGLSYPTGVGLSAGLIDPHTENLELQGFLRRGRRLFHAVNLRVEFIRPKQQKYPGHGVVGQYAYFYCMTAKEARELLLRKLDPLKLPLAASH